MRYFCKAIRLHSKQQGKYFGQQGARCIEMRDQCLFGENTRWAWRSNSLTNSRLILLSSSVSILSLGYTQSRASGAPLHDISRVSPTIASLLRRKILPMMWRESCKGEVLININCRCLTSVTKRPQHTEWFNYLPPVRVSLRCQRLDFSTRVITPACVCLHANTERCAGAPTLAAASSDMPRISPWASAEYGISDETLPRATTAQQTTL